MSMDVNPGAPERAVVPDDHDGAESAPPISALTRAAVAPVSETPPTAEVMKRIVVRLDPIEIAGLDRLKQRCKREGISVPSRAALVRVFLGLRSWLKPHLSLREQLPALLSTAPRRRTTRRPAQTGPTLRSRIVTVLATRPGEVFTPATLAPLVRAPNRDVVRNTLLVLGNQGRVVKVGLGQYRGLDGASPTPPSQSPAETQTTSTLGERILSALAERRGEVFTPTALAPLVQARPGSVGDALRTLANKGRVIKVSLGRYRALDGNRTGRTLPGKTTSETSNGDQGSS